MADHLEENPYKADSIADQDQFESLASYEALDVTDHIEDHSYADNIGDIFPYGALDSYMWPKEEGGDESQSEGERPIVAEGVEAGLSGFDEGFENEKADELPESSEEGWEYVTPTFDRFEGEAEEGFTEREIFMEINAVPMLTHEEMEEGEWEEDEGAYSYDAYVKHEGLGLEQGEDGPVDVGAVTDALFESRMRGEINFVTDDEVEEMGGYDEYYRRSRGIPEDPLYMPSGLGDSVMGRFANLMHGYGFVGDSALEDLNESMLEDAKYDPYYRADLAEKYWGRNPYGEGGGDYESGGGGMILDGEAIGVDDPEFDRKLTDWLRRQDDDDEGGDDDW